MVIGKRQITPGTVWSWERRRPCWGGNRGSAESVSRCSQRVEEADGVLDTGDIEELRCVRDTQGGMRGSVCVHQAGGIGKRNIVTCSGCRGETGPARGLLYYLLKMDPSVWVL